MTIDRIRLRSDKLGDIAVLNLFGTDIPQRYRIKAVTGLDAPDIAPVIYGSGSSGTRFYTMSLDPRSIVMRIGLNPDVVSGESFQDLRARVYRAISADRNPRVFLDLMDGADTHSTIEGFLTKVEASSFTSQPEIQLTLECSYPLFTGSLVEEFDLDEFNTGVITINEEIGTAPTGFQMEVDITNPLSSWGIADPDSDWVFNIVYNFLVSDVLYLNTEPGSLDVYVQRFNSDLGVEEKIRLGDRVTATSMWPVLFPGENVFQITAAAGLYDISSVSYSPKFWGL